METIKIIHIADMHFDAPMSGFSDRKKAETRKEEAKDTFSRIIDEAVKREVDALLIAGDMFDSDFVLPQTIKFLQNCFKKLGNIPVFISPGNHDFNHENSIYSNTLWGENVHIFSDEISFFDIKNARIYGYGFAERFISEPKLEGFSADDKISIMVMHGDLQANSQYNPISLKHIKDSGLDYLALGHIHKFDGIKKEGATTYAYSGTHEGKFFDEEGSCGFIYGEVGKGVANLQHINFAKREVKSIDVSVSGLLTYDEIAEKIRDAISDSKDIYKITLTGEIGEGVFLNLAILEEKIHDLCFQCKVYDKTEIKKGGETGTIRAAFEEKFAGKDDEVSALALKYGIAALLGREI